jgi:hypothetical protein
VTDQFATIVLGFLLTTIIGGLFGFYLQQRAWRHQNEQRLLEGELRRADELCQSLSRLLDKRVYRMLRLFLAVKAYAEGRGDVSNIKDRLAEYNALLYEWNDQLNSNLAMGGTYFGEGAREYLDHQIYDAFKQVGRGLEEVVRQALAQSPLVPETLGHVEAGISRMNNRVYVFGVFMMTQLRDGRVGRQAPDVLRPEQVYLDRGGSTGGKSAEGIT